MESSNTYITVIPYLPLMTNRSTLNIDKLCYWFNKTYNHPVTDDNVQLFLQLAKMFKPTVFPEKPQLGIYAIGGDIQWEKGETPVNEIYYKGIIIYCRH